MGKVQKFNKPITEIIGSRVSIRSYLKDDISSFIRGKIKEYINNLSCELNGNVKFKLVENMNLKDKDIKLGTYGVIRGASSFIVAASGKGKDDLIKLGFELEDIILFATSLGLGTCWLGGTFKRSEFSKTIELQNDEIVPIITPIGYPKRGTDIIGSLFRFVAGSKNRKNFSEIFFDGDFINPLSKADNDIYSEALEMTRLAPSASNKQPWRIVKDGDKFHFFLCHTKGYGESIGFAVQYIDMGIAMCHFDITLKELGKGGKFINDKPSITIPEGTEYIISYTP